MNKALVYITLDYADVDSINIKHLCCIHSRGCSTATSSVSRHTLGGSNVYSRINILMLTVIESS